MQRISIPEIKNHPWFVKNFAVELTDGYQESLRTCVTDAPTQSIEEIISILQEARMLADVSAHGMQSLAGGSADLDDLDEDIDLDD